MRSRDAAEAAPREADPTGTNSRLTATPQWLHEGLAAVVGEGQVLTRPLDLARCASDASPYRMLPQVVVMARDGDDVAGVLRFAERYRLPVTFRAAGTSLNGQAQGDGILVDVRRHFAAAVVEDGGLRLRARPGMVVARANALLTRHGRMLGPDPASSGAATVGGGGGQQRQRDVLRHRTQLVSNGAVDAGDPRVGHRGRHRRSRCRRASRRPRAGPGGRAAGDQK
ncbi:FAD-binding oxidoreductase [Spirillospora sp. NPDC048911]|uniref:FAD-binding oxidoreductase n=1 Tax=Spirillospora sp. NPDC048911 TaxID=3364527 RepID=UPI00371E58F5